MKKKILMSVVLIALLLFASLMNVNAEANSSNEKNWDWILDGEGRLIISGTGEMDNWSDASQAPWYGIYWSIRSVIIEEGITNIGSYAFSDCAGLESIIIPNSVTSIGDSAFSDCMNFENIQYIGSEIDWEKISIGKNNDYLISATTQYDYIFDTIVARGHWTEKSDELIWNLDYKGKLTISGTGDMISWGGMFGAPWHNNHLEIRTVVIEEGLKSIAEYAFHECANLTSIKIPDSVTKIENGAFYEASNLRSIIIPEGVTSIGEEAFFDCTSLTYVELPDSVEKIGNSAFYNTGYYNYSDEENCDLYIGNHLISVNNVSGEYNIKPGTITIADSAFSSYSDVAATVTVPESVKNIGEGAFAGCINLANITVAGGNANYSSVDGVLFNKDKTALIQFPAGRAGTYNVPDSVKKIGNGAFLICRNLTAVTIPNGVTSIGERVFENCDILTDITIPDSVNNIGFLAFYGTGYYNNEENWENNVLYIGNHLINAKTYDISGEYIIKEGTVTIADEAFSSCSSLTKIEIPNSVKSIGERAFTGCRGITDLIIPDSVTSIGAWAFAHCQNLKNIVISKNIKTISDCAFYSCRSLEEVIIPNGVTSIGEEAFSSCEKLMNIEIPSSVTSIGERAFGSCETLAEVTIPNGVTSIGDRAFAYCKSLINIKIPNGVTNIGYDTFENCESLTSITIPDSVTNIEEDAFDWCESLTDVYYGGSESDWKKISIDESNYCLLNATIHYGSKDDSSSNPSNPSTPTNPSIPSTPSTPSNPSTPSTPEISAEPEITSYPVRYYKEVNGDFTISIDFNDGILSKVKINGYELKSNEYSLGKTYITIKENVVQSLNVGINNLELCFQNDYSLKTSMLVLDKPDNSQYESKTTDYLLYVDDKKIVMDICLYKINGEYFSSIRGLGEGIEAFVSWDGDIKTAIFEKGNDILCVPVDNKQLVFNGNSIYADTPAQIIAGRTLVPIKAIAECFGYKYQVDDSAKRIYLKEDSADVGGNILKGDVLADGKVNAKDAVRLAQYLAKWEITLTDSEMLAADVVADGKINAKDAVKLAQFLARWDITLD